MGVFRVPDVGKNLSFPQIQSTLQKARRKHHPEFPNCAVEFHHLITSKEWRSRFGNCLNGKQFYRENVQIYGSNNLVFISENTKHLLARSDRFYFDGTFQSLPSVPGLRQLFVIMSITDDYVSKPLYNLSELI